MLSGAGTRGRAVLGTTVVLGGQERDEEEHDFFGALRHKRTGVLDQHQRRFVLVRDDPGNFGLEEAEEREPNSSPAGISVHQRLVVGERVVVQEEAGSYVEGYEDIDGVMFVSRQDEEDSEHVQHPREGVKEVNISGGI